VKSPIPSDRVNFTLNSDTATAPALDAFPAALAGTQSHIALYRLSLQTTLATAATRATVDGSWRWRGE
jgi:hypothetical protein